MTNGRRWSRRAVIGGGIGAVGLPLIVPSVVGIAGAQTPAASPAASGDRGSFLIDAATLADERSRTELRVTALTPPDVFIAGHIPGARTVDWPALEISTTTESAIAAWTNEMKPLVSSLGSGAAFGVAIYDEGSLFGCRVWWVLDYLGYDNKVILDGGLPAWTAAGLPTETGEQDPFTTPGFEELPLRPEVLAPIDEVAAAVGDPDVVFVDARTPDEYAKGHIPGAVNISYQLNAEPEPPRFWKSDEPLRAMYGEAGVTQEKRVIPYCTTGVRSSVTWLTLRMLGFADTSLFTGSWAEWSADPGRPVTTGPNP
jgi:thiosulfate/3-mercaptopyruvate sulfurtransferase